jgi:hypothetical protein
MYKVPRSFYMDIDMELTLPPIPTAPGAQLAMLSVVITTIIGLIWMLFARTVARRWGFASREGREGAEGELRPAGGFVAGLGLAGLLFDQPVIYVMIACAWALAAFGRLLSMMSASDRSNGLFNFLFLLIQVALAGAAFYWLFDVWTGSVNFSIPQDQAGFVVFVAAAVVSAIGATLMFFPELVMMMAGLSVGEGRSRVIASVRSFGGFMLGAGGVAILASNPMCELALGAAVGLSLFGRLASLVFERGRYIFQVVALLLTAAGAGIFFGHVFGYF